MKSYPPPIGVFLAGIVAACVLVFPQVLDITLTARFTGLSVLLVVFFFLLKSGSFFVRLNVVVAGYLLYSLFMVLSICWSVNKAEAMFSAARQVLFLLVFLCTAFLLVQHGDGFINPLLKILTITPFLTLGVGFYQLGALQNLTHDSSYMVTGLNGHKNLLSSFLFISLFFFIAAVYRLTRPWRVLALAGILLCLIMIFLLKTKAVAAGMVVALVVWALLYIYKVFGKKVRVRLPVILLLFIGLGLSNLFFLYAMRPLINRGLLYVDTGAQGSVGLLRFENERLVLWDKTYRLFDKHPVVGVGTGNWQVNFPDATLTGLWRAEDLNFTFQRPHNDWLWMLSETGLVGFNLFSAFVWLLLIYLARTLGSVFVDKKDQWSMMLCVAFVVAYLVISFFDFPGERIEHGVLFNVLLGITCYYITRYNGLQGPFFRVGRPLYLLLCCLLGAIAWLGITRSRGEYYMRRLYDVRDAGQTRQVITAGYAALSSAYSLDPTSMPVHWYTGNAHAVMGNYELAHYDFLKALAYNPYNRNVLNDLGSSYALTGDVLLAKKYYEESARISPRFDEPRLNLAALYIKEKDYKTAANWLSSLMHNSDRRSNYQRIVEANLVK